MSDVDRKIIPFRPKQGPTPSAFPERALTASEWLSLIFDQAAIKPEAFDFVCESVEVDVPAVEEIIRRIAKYGVLGG